MPLHKRTAHLLFHIAMVRYFLIKMTKNILNLLEENGPVLLLKSLWQPPLRVALLESSLKRDRRHSVKFETDSQVVVILL